MNFNLCMAFVVGTSFQLLAQTHSEKIVKEFNFEKTGEHNALMIANINGDIQVQAATDNKITLEVTKSINAKTDQRLTMGKEEIQLGVVDLADTIILYVSSPCHHFERSTPKSRHSHMGTKWGYAWQDHGRSCHELYNYTLDFVVRVPPNVNLLLSTINDGNVSVENVKGVVKANNINGAIKLQNLSSAAEAHTINGDVDIEYAQNPQRECRFYTLNGDINALFERGLTANLAFQSFNGSLYTNIDRLETLPAQVVEEKKDGQIKYKINDNQFKVGAGGPFLEFETFNGNVYLKEKTN